MLWSIVEMLGRFAEFLMSIHPDDIQLENINAREGIKTKGKWFWWKFSQGSNSL